MRLGKTILNSFIFLFNKGWCCKNLIQICLVWQDHRCISCWCLWVTVIPHSWMTWQRQTTVVNLSLPFVRLLHMILMIAIHSVMIYFPSSDLSIRMAWSRVTIISHDARGKNFLEWLDKVYSWPPPPYFLFKTYRNLQYLLHFVMGNGWGGGHEYTLFDYPQILDFACTWEMVTFSPKAPWDLTMSPL